MVVVCVCVPPSLSRETSQAKEMIRTFVKPGGSEVVNMTDETRVALTAAVSDGAITVDMFAEQKAAAFKDMSGDTLPRFMKSDLYEEATKASAAGESKLVAASHAHEDTVLVGGRRDACLLACLLGCVPHALSVASPFAAHAEEEVPGLEAQTAAHEGGLTLL